MEYIMVGLLTLNTIILLAIAGSLAKLIRYTNGDTGRSRDQWAEIVRSRHRNDALKRLPNYSETQPLPPAVYDRPANWDGLPRGRNWDGLPQIEEV